MNIYIGGNSSWTPGPFTARKGTSLENLYCHSDFGMSSLLLFFYFTRYVRKNRLDQCGWKRWKPNKPVETWTSVHPAGLLSTHLIHSFSKHSCKIHVFSSSTPMKTNVFGLFSGLLIRANFFLIWMTKKFFVHLWRPKFHFDRKFFFWIEPSVSIMGKMSYKSLPTLYQARKILEVT